MSDLQHGYASGWQITNLINMRRDVALELLASIPVGAKRAAAIELALENLEDWNSPLAVILFKEVYHTEGGQSWWRFRKPLSHMAATNPPAAFSYFGQELNTVRALFANVAQADRLAARYPNTALYHAFDLLLGMVEHLQKSMSAEVLFELGALISDVSAMLPADFALPSEYHRDGLFVSHFVDPDTKSPSMLLADCLLQVASTCAKSTPNQFGKFMAKYQGSDFMLLHRAICHGLFADPDRYATLAADYLLSDPKRLALGENDIEASRLIGVIWPCLDLMQRARLEDACYAADKARSADNPVGYYFLRWLRFVPDNDLTSNGLARRMAALACHPNPVFGSFPTSEFGSVASPISEDELKAMSDKDVLDSMRKFGPEYVSREFLHGDMREFAQQIEAAAEHEPVRYATIAGQIDDGIDRRYVAAIIGGISRSGSNSNLLIPLVIQFGPQFNAELRMYVSWALARLHCEVPEDIMDMLRMWIDEVAEWRSIASPPVGPDAYATAALNSTCGAALHALTTLLLAQPKPSSAAVFDYLETVAVKGDLVLQAMALMLASDVVRLDCARAVRLVLHVLSDDTLLHERMTELFLYRSQTIATQAQLNWIARMLASDAEQVQRSGAQLACIYALRHPGAHCLRDAAHGGSVVHRSSAARAYAVNAHVREIHARCMEHLSHFASDGDSEVRERVGLAFHQLGGSQFESSQQLVEAVLKNPLTHNTFRDLADFLNRCVSVHPEKCLDLAVRLLDHTESGALNDPYMQLGASCEGLVSVAMAAYQRGDAKVKARALDFIDRIEIIAPRATQAAFELWDRD